MFTGNQGWCWRSQPPGQQHPRHHRRACWDRGRRSQLRRAQQPPGRGQEPQGQVRQRVRQLGQAAQAPPFLTRGDVKVPRRDGQLPHLDGEGLQGAWGQGEATRKPQQAARQHGRHQGIRQRRHDSWRRPKVPDHVGTEVCRSLQSKSVLQTTLFCSNLIH